MLKRSSLVKSIKCIPDFSSRFRILKGGKISLVVSALIGGTTISYGAPTGGVVTNGSAVIRQMGLVTNIDQSSQRATINWNSFSIGTSETVNFNQPNRSSITLNRVVGNETSLIEGALNANGQVWILNSSGILFAQGASVNTAGLVASTMNISDENFMNGNHTFESTGSSESVINMGTVEITDGGYAALMAKHVSNEGYIKATKGNITLASGDKIILNFNGDSLVGVTIDQGTLDALVENKGAIIADGGAIYLTTKAATDLLNGVVNNNGVLRAQSLDDLTGHIEVFAHGGTATVSGTLDASAPVNGDGGFIETSGLIVNIAEETAITTASENGAGGTWLIDPINVTISTLADLSGTFDGTLWTPTATGSRIQNTTIQNALNTGTNVTITTTGALAEAGNITVSATITKSAGSDATLTLKADNNIAINQNITSTSGALNLILDHGNAGTATLTIGDTINLLGGTLDVQKASVTSTGTLNSAGTITNATLKAGTYNDNGSSSKVSNVIFGSNMALTGTTKVEGNLVIADGMTLTLGASRYINFISPTASISTTGTTGTIVMNSGGINRNADGQALSIDSGITISGRGVIYNNLYTNGSLTNNGTIELTTGAGGILHGSLVNNGTLSMSAAGQIMTIGPASFTNNGTINLNAASGWILMNATNWSNAGTINVTNGGLVLGGTFTTAGLGTIARTGGTISLSGILDNTFAVLDIGSNGVFGTGGLSSLTSLQLGTNKGTIFGGTIVSNDGTTLKSTSGPATLDGVTIGGNLTLGNSVGIMNNLNLGNGITLSLGANSLFFNSAASSITTPVSATITMNGTTTGLIRNLTGQSLTIGSGITINGKGTIKDASAAYNGTLTNNGTIDSTTGNITISNGTFTNNGTLTATMGTFIVNPATFTNAGTANVSGGTLTLSPTSWSNTGTLNVTSGTLNLDGGFTTAGIGAITRTGGSVNITGTLDNTGSTLDIGSATFGTGGLSSLAGGTILGGTVVSNDGTVLVGGASAVLDGVTLGGTNLTMSSNFGFQNNILLVDGLVIDKGNGNWGINSTGIQHIGIAGGSGSATINNAGGWIIAGNGVTGQTFQIDSGITLQGYGDIRQNLTNNMIINNGNIVFNTAAQSSTLGATNFTNNGTISNQAGAFDIYGTFANNGTISVPAGTFSVGTGTFTNNGSGTVNINGGTMGFTYTNTVWNNAGVFNVSSGNLKLGGLYTTAGLGTIVRTGGAIGMYAGTLDNTGDTLNIGDTGIFGVGGLTTLWGGTIKGGTVIGTTLNTTNGRLDNVTIGNNLSLNGGLLYIDNDLFLANGINFNLGNTHVTSGITASNIALVSGATAATVVMPWGSVMSGSSAIKPLSIGSGVTVDWSWNGGLGTNGYLINNGTILKTGSGSATFSNDSFINNGTILIQSGTYGISSTAFVNNGTISVASGGTFRRDALFTNTGTLSGSGTLDVGLLVNQGTINLGGTGTAGTLAIMGDLLLDTGSILTAELGGTSAGQYDTLAVSGAVSLGGTLNSSLIGGYAPADADAISFITAGSSSGTFGTSNLPSGFSLAYAQTAGEAARLTYTAPVVVTPLEPRFTASETSTLTQTQLIQTALSASSQIATTLGSNTITNTIPITLSTPPMIPHTPSVGENAPIVLANQNFGPAGSFDPGLAMESFSVDNGGIASDGTKDPVVRFDLGKNSFAHLIKGGIHLPKGAKQEFYVAKKEADKGKNQPMARNR